MNELLKRIENLERENGELKAFVESLKSVEKIPLEVDQALRARLITASTLSVSTKDQASEDASVRNAADDGATNVLDDPDGFLQIQIEATTYYLPYYT